MKTTVLFLSVLLTYSLVSCNNSGNNDLKVITFNIRYDNPGDKINAWPNRESIVCDFLSNEKPDLFGLQEALWHQYEAIDAGITGYSSVVAGRDDGEKKGETNPAFYNAEKFENVRQGTFWLSETPEIPGTRGWGASLPRIVSWLELKVKKTGKTLFYFNTHFAHDSDSARIMSAGILLEKVKQITGDDDFVITGDFNMEPSSRAYDILTEPGKSTPFLIDAYTISESPPEGPVQTFNGWSDTGGNRRIDYIFVKNGARVRSISTLTRKDGDIYISDHWPVRAIISF